MRNIISIDRGDLLYLVNETVKRVLSESQESDSQKLAIRYIMQNHGWDKEKANFFVRKTLRDKITPLKNKRIAKFTLGVTRMWFNGEFDDEHIISPFNATLPLLSAHLDEYDKNLNGLSAVDIIEKFAQVRQEMSDNMRQEIDAMDFSAGSNYDIVKIESFEQAKEYYTYTNPRSRWCLTHMMEMYDNYTNNGINQIYFCLRHGFENVERAYGDNFPLDDYGLSMISVIVDENGDLAYCTTRWNHERNSGDKSMDEREISQVVGVNFYQTFKPNHTWRDMVADAQRRLQSGEPIENVFNDVRYNQDEFIGVCLKNRWNYLTRDNRFLSKKWFCNIYRFSEGFGLVMNESSKYNYINAKGQFLSSSWFEWADNFKGEFAMVGIERDRDGYGCLFNIINKNGKFLFDQPLEECLGFGDGDYAACCHNDRVGDWFFINKNGETVLVVNDVLNNNERCYQVIAISGTRAILAIGQRSRHYEDHPSTYARPVLKCVIMDILSGKVLYATDYGKRLSSCGRGFFVELKNTEVYRILNSNGEPINNDWYSSIRGTFNKANILLVKLCNSEFYDYNLLRPDGTYVFEDNALNIVQFPVENIVFKVYPSNDTIFFLVDGNGVPVSKEYFKETIFSPDYKQTYVKDRKDRIWEVICDETGTHLVPYK
jgi:hypothetical protein